MTSTAQHTHMFYQTTVNGKPASSARTASTEVAQLLARGEITLQTKVWSQGMTGWAPLGIVKETFEGFERTEISAAASTPLSSTPVSRDIGTKLDQSGTLYRKRGFGSNWKKQWGEVTDAHLRLLASESRVEEASIDLKEVVAAQISTLPGHSTAQFEIVTVKCTHQFRCDSEDEVDAWIATISRAVTGTMSKHLTELFKEADVDKNGYLDPAEMRHAITELLDHTVSDEDFKKLIDDVDRNGDGRIDYTEAAPVLYTMLKDCGRPVAASEEHHDLAVAQAKIVDLEQKLATVTSTMGAQTEHSASSSSVIGVYKVVSATGVIVRKGVSVVSEQIGQLDAGTEVEAYERGDARRLRTSLGWVSEKATDGTRLMLPVTTTFGL